MTKTERKARWKSIKKEVKEARRTMRGGPMQELHISDFNRILAGFTKSTKVSPKSVVRGNRTDYSDNYNRHVGHVIVHRRTTQAFVMKHLMNYMPKEEESAIAA